MDLEIVPPQQDPLPDFGSVEYVTLPTIDALPLAERRKMIALGLAGLLLTIGSIAGIRVARGFEPFSFGENISIINDN